MAPIGEVNTYPGWVLGIAFSIPILVLMAWVAKPWLVFLVKRYWGEHAKRAANILVLTGVLVAIWSAAGLHHLAWLILLVSLIVKALPLVLGVLAVLIAYQGLQTWKRQLRGTDEYNMAK